MDLSIFDEFPRYEDGLHELADNNVTILGASEDWWAPISSLLRAGGEFTQSEAERRAAQTASTGEKGRLVAVGEAAFNAMKAAAVAAKWPSDLSPQIVFLDKSWQATKNGSNLAEIQRLTTEMQMMGAQLGARMGAGAGMPYRPAAPPPPSGGVRVGIPWWVWLVGASAIGGVGYLGYRAFKAKPVQKMLTAG